MGVTACWNMSTIAYRIKEKIELQPTYSANSIHGLVNHIDSYENLITNIPQQLFEKVRAGRNYTININSSNYKINKIIDSYQDVYESEILAIFGTHGFLEIAICRGKAASLLGMDRDSAVDIYFEDEKTNPKGNTLF